MARIYLIHENDEWTAPLRDALAARGLPFEDWHMAEGKVDLGLVPPEGVFYNRMSASSHTRGHRYAPELTGALLDWLELHDRRVVNGSRALAFEIAKTRQYAALDASGIRTPRTIAAVGRHRIIEAARAMPGAFITKHNRAGKGLGVHLFESPDALAAYLDSAAFEPSVDGVTLIQEYIEAPEPTITRLEFIGGRFLYALRVDTSAGFLLCPADSCAADAETARRPKFEIIEGFAHPLVGRLEVFLRRHGIEVAGVEFIVDAAGRSYTFDINTNTNYNSAAEARAGVSGLGALADFLGRERTAVERGLKPSYYAAA